VAVLALVVAVHEDQAAKALLANHGFPLKGTCVPYFICDFVRTGYFLRRLVARPVTPTRIVARHKHCACIPCEKAVIRSVNCNGVVTIWGARGKILARLPISMPEAPSNLGAPGLMDNNFLNFINRSIGENARFVRDYRANPEKYARPSVAAPPDPMAQMMAAFSPMMLLMMSQMLTTQGGWGAPLPIGYYTPLLNNPGEPNQAPASRNPAIGYLESLFRSKSVAQPEADFVLTSEDVAKVRDDLAQGAFQPAELGQALKYELDQAPEEHLPGISRLLTDLMDSGTLNIGPFLQNDYLDRLSEDRRELLLQTIELAGLRMDSGKPNTRFIGFMLEELNRPDHLQTQALLRRFLQDFYDTHGSTPETPVGKILTSVLQLADISADEQGQLQF
jgi:hypothetical protein